MSFLIGNSKKNISGNNPKLLEDKQNPLSQRDYYQKLISSKKYNEIDLSKLYASLLDSKIILPKYNTLKNSRNKNILI